MDALNLEARPEQLQRPALWTPDQILSDWAPTPTGLAVEEVRSLSDGDLKVLGAWHAGVAGDVSARPFWPAAIRRLTLDERMAMASDETLSEIWKDRERRRVRESVGYFVDGYGHVQAQIGPPEPFVLWGEQRGVLAEMIENLRLIILKARQLGLTWLALHHAFHILAFDEASPVAKILALSKHGGDATKLLKRARRINELLPPYLRLAEQEETKRSLSKFGIEGRGEMISLAGTPDAARSESASYVLMDEFAFIRHGGGEDTWTAVLPTLGEFGRVTVISTGNGPEEAPGDGQAFARLWKKARTGDPEAGLVAIFLPDSCHPDRNEEWRRKERKKFFNDEEFRKEHPETEDDAFATVSGLRVYSPGGVNAAEILGRKYDEMLLRDELPLPEYIYIGSDYGEYTHMLLIWPLEGGGIYVAPGEVAPDRPQEVGESTKEILASALLIQRESDEEVNGEFVLEPLIRSNRYDAAGIQSNRTFVKTVQTDTELLKQWDVVYQRGKEKIRAQKIAFGKYKDDTKDYLRHLFERSAKAVAEESDEVRIIAISPRNKKLLRQLRTLELKDDGTGRIEKGDDHGPDALIAGAAPIAVRMHDR